MDRNTPPGYSPEYRAARAKLPKSRPSPTVASVAKFVASRESVLGPSHEVVVPDVDQLAAAVVAFFGPRDAVRYAKRFYAAMMRTVTSLPIDEDVPDLPASVDGLRKAA